MSPLAKTLLLGVTILATPFAQANTVSCTATCVMSGTKEDMITVQGKGVDTQDAVTDLKKSCEDAAKTSKATTHYLATSFNKPNATYTTTQTEFNVKQACI